MKVLARALFLTVAVATLAAESQAQTLSILNIDLTEQPDGRFASRANAECYNFWGNVDYSCVIGGRHKIAGTSGPELAARDVTAAGEYIGFIHGNPAPGKCYRATLDAYISGQPESGKYLTSYLLCKDPIEPVDPPHSTCPILLDLDLNGYHLSGTNDPVRFDLDADGVAEAIAWTSFGERDAFLCHDLNRNGIIDNGRELFGQATLLINGAEAPNGYSALSELDLPQYGGNLDGVLGPADLKFADLCAWVDADHDGVSQPEELLDLTAAGIRRLGYDYRGSRRRDAHGNLFRYWGKAWIINPAGRERVHPTVDVFFALPQP